MNESAYGFSFRQTLRSEPSALTATPFSVIHLLLVTHNPL